MAGHVRRTLTWSAVFLYGCVVAAAVWHHEPWADEAQAWLLARDAGLTQLWTKLLHYEGSPGLWHTLLWVLIKAGVPYRGEELASASLGLGAAWILLTRSPFPLVFRIFLPFTYFLCYQYVVVARSYSLLPLLLFVIALLYPRAEQRCVLFIGLLSLLAAVSAHGFLLSGSIWIAARFDLMRKWRHLDKSTRNRVLITDSAYLVALSLIALATWPAHDVGFPVTVALSASKIIRSTNLLLVQGFSGNLYLTLLILGLSIPFLYSGGSLFLFLGAVLALVGFGGVVYSQVWHSGSLFLAWLCAMWISGARVKMPRPAMAAMAMVTAVQCYWTVQIVAYDWREPYSGSKAAAAYLRATGIATHSIHAFGYSCTAIQPYFTHNIFTNYGSSDAYWDWTTRNRVNEPGALFAATAPEYVMLGYKAHSEIENIPGILQLAGYDELKHFRGGLFWRTSIFEVEDFDLYRRTGRSPVAHLSYLDMGNPASAKQLLSGFYLTEGQAWRWSARTFSAVLKKPEHDLSSGTKFELHVFMPAEQLRRLGPVTANCDVNGYRLAPQTFSIAGTYTYERDIPAGAFTGEVAVVRCAFDKAAPPLSGDGRELGAVISSLGFSPRP